MKLRTYLLLLIALVVVASAVVVTYEALAHGIVTLHNMGRVVPSP